MKLEEIGFYTLSNDRARQASVDSPLWRGELLLTGRCNFRCPYCRSVGGKDIDPYMALDLLNYWAGLKNIRFSGGEPTLYPHLGMLVKAAKELGVERIALSTNGSAPRALYYELLDQGVNDLSISLDACCAEDGDRMSGGVKDAFDRVVMNIQRLSERTYVTVGTVLTPYNKQKAEEIIAFAAGLGVADIRVIPAAQDGQQLPALHIDEAILRKYPILRYRHDRLRKGQHVRGLLPSDPKRCRLVLDDMAVMGDDHYPCIIYMREGGSPIGKVSKTMRRERLAWSHVHDTHADPICSKNCLDVCVDYNRVAEEAGAKATTVGEVVR